MTDDQLVQYAQQQGYCLPLNLTIAEKASILRLKAHAYRPRWDIIIQRKIIF